MSQIQNNPMKKYKYLVSYAVLHNKTGII